MSEAADVVEPPAGASVVLVPRALVVSAMGAAVSEATTKAVVMGIVLIVVSASILTVIYVNLGI